ncbi:uncharacterized protein LOC110703757 [Chenopodium quinoa]|uniref:uncharacterized protein LOC110703757 n=1 Tax=Chenopodium quinoa TaxID=63459 RepID=UPI000B789E63|nr:uncharacterized protein LOC110703757 [Chenopodium quinoa]
MVHRLNVREDIKPVRQKKRSFFLEKNQAIQEEVEKLLEARFIKPCDYPEWLANVVMLLKGNREFKWGAVEKEAFEGIKEHLSKLPTMISPGLREKLQQYISASIQTIAVVLVVERQKQQRPIYFVSHVLTEAEQRYPLVEKLAFVVVTTTRKLKPYFDVHTIQILTNHPLEKASQKRDAFGRLLKLAIELSEYELDDDIGIWKVKVYGSSSQTGSGAGIIITSPEGNVFEYAIKFKFKASNNEAEYEASLAGLRIAAGARKVRLQTNSQLVNSQLRGAYEIRESTMFKYVIKVKELSAQLVHFQIDLVPRVGNSKADALSKLASSTLQNLTRTVMVEVFEESSITEKEQVNYIGQQRAWFTDIRPYKVHGSLADDEVKAKKVKKDANWYVVIYGEFKKKGFSKPLLRCVPEWEHQSIMDEAHSRICANHIGGKALEVEVLRRGAYLTTLAQDALAYVKNCDKCQ